MNAEQKETRKLSAILSADVKGYSILMTNDETSTIRTLKEYRIIMSELIKEHSGRIVDAPGDNLLAEFTSAVNAVQCSVEIQKALKIRNAELPDDKRLEFRIGVNIGDVVQDGDSLYGEGVNIAARIEGLADPGGVCISRGTYDHIRNKLGFGYEYLGDHSVKNIKHPVRVYKILTSEEDAGKLIGEKSKPVLKSWIWSTIVVAAIILTLTGYQLFQKITAPEFEPASIGKMALPLPDVPSIAVLPFVNMSGDPKQEFFSDAITENIITVLSKVPRLFVISRQSTFFYKGKPVKVKQVSEEFGVQYVLEGSVQRSADRIRINVQLIDALTGHHLWAERYESDQKDLFAVQDEMTMKILQSIRVKLSEGEISSAYSQYFRGRKGFDCYLKIMEAAKYADRFTLEDYYVAQRLLEEAIAICPENPIGYVRLGWAYRISAILDKTKPYQEALEKAKEMIKKALAMDDTLADAHILLSILYRAEKEYDKSIAAGRRAVELDPSGSTAYTYYGAALLFASRPEEAIPLLQKAIRLNPNAEAWTFVFLGHSFRNTGRLEEAISAYKKVLQRAPDHLIAHIALTTVYSLMGQDEEARAEAQEVLRINPKFSLIPFKKKALVFKDKSENDMILKAMTKALQK
ncbi:adenylate/guanylate cyclase domain-containing protein [Desulfobacula sp.]|uniref:adenylate/guanylate cyclase domain-containing protein n=1 Tax=Desulfobacula sp. TaxID=2593537 RepID=UPI0025BB1F4F|nr:adenylate/guanylate cyclase domain-containing protein [Desulfobacula sp.]MBC2702998.1 adenylate/guanylate cyclase domain-containing protein [Desulfobacula sp.]